MPVIKFKNSAVQVDKDTVPDHFESVVFQTHLQKDSSISIRGYYNSNEGIFYNLEGNRFSFLEVFQWEYIPDTGEIMRIKIKDLIDRENDLSKEIIQVINKKNSILAERMKKKEITIKNLLDIIENKDSQLNSLETELFKLKEIIKKENKNELYNNRKKPD